MLRIFRLLMLTIWIQEIFARPYHLQEPLPPNSLAPLIEQFASRTSSSSSFRPGAFEVDSALRKLHRQPRSVRTSASEVSSQQQQPQLSYRSSHQVKFRLKGVYQLFLRGSSSGVSAGHQGHLSNQVCFRVHTFHATPAYPEGYVVALETPTGGSVLKGVGNNVSLVSSNGLSGATSVDDRFFLIFSDPGDTYVRIKHLSSGRFLSASASGVTLDVLNTSSDSFLFLNFTCS